MNQLTESKLPPSSPVPEDSGTVVIVDDQELIRMSLSRLVNAVQDGLRILTFSNGLEAWQYLATDCESVDLLITDLNMPGLDGLELIERVRGTGCASHLPIVMITAVDAADVRRQALELGATDFLARPINDDECRIRCRNLLALSKSRRMLKSQYESLMQTLGPAGDTSRALTKGAVPSDEGTVTLPLRALQELTSAFSAASQLLEHGRAQIDKMEADLKSPLVGKKSDKAAKRR
jgi:CheY-like chemotaxis protein